MIGRESIMSVSSSRAVCPTELSWCRAIPTGTGITVLALLFSKPPTSPSLKTPSEASNPPTPSSTPGSASTPPPTPSPTSPPNPPTSKSAPSIPNPPLTFSSPNSNPIPPLHLILEHELNTNSWQNPKPSSDTGNSVLALCLHTSACDRAGAGALLKELVTLLEEKHGMIQGESGKEMKVSSGIEDCIPSGQGNMPFWN
ncbi:hypothetical protein SASPL_137355 [Salvia splendens]|uniref:Uncharacterized protein n=1 Tax=Salvia splendens TaxID=180675 RepID=A0A8X8WUS8_SALSN|nr:hypothetical protein SASPL_137355 [Salvia splendens]